jgi:hypothetical protein
MKMGGLGFDGRRKEVVYGHDIFFQVLGKANYN